MAEDWNNQESVFKKLWLFFLDFIETIVIALAIFVIIYRFLFQPHQVIGQSMYDNFHNGEYLLTNKLDYQLHKPQRGEVMVFKAPKNEDYDYIKRVIAIPGDTIEIKDGQVLVNNSLLDESGYLDPQIKTSGGRFAREGVAITVPAKYYFVMGDNRNNSSDSRDWGLVPEENIVGKAWVRYWPINRSGLIKKYPKLKQ